MKTLIEMAHEVYGEHVFWTEDQLLKLKAFEALVRADERTRLTVPDAITDKSESPEYLMGWNDCRAEMLKGQP